MRTDQMRSDKLRPGKMRTDNSKQTKFTFWGRPAPLSLVVFLSFLSVNAGALTLSIQERYHHLWTDLLHIAVFLKTSFDDCCSDHHPLSFLIINWLFPKLRMAFMQLAALLNWLLFSCFCICIWHSREICQSSRLLLVGRLLLSPPPHLSLVDGSIVSATFLLHCWYEAE